MNFREQVAGELENLLRTEAAVHSEMGVPATEQQISAAEASIGLSFPISYRTFLSRCGAFNFFYMRIYGLVESILDPDERFVDVAVMTNYHRTMEGMEGLDPSQIVIIGDDPNGYFFYADVSKAKEEKVPVFMWTEDEARKKVADDFIDFLRMILFSDSNHPFNES